MPFWVLIPIGLSHGLATDSFDGSEFDKKTTALVRLMSPFLRWTGAGADCYVDVLPQPDFEATLRRHGKVCHYDHSIPGVGATKSMAVSHLGRPLPMRSVDCGRADACSGRMRV